VGDLTKTAEDIKKAQEKITGRKFCSSCHSYKLIDGGKDLPITSGKSTRWKCASCIARISARKYESKKVK
jgi:hypothetical protein